MANRAYLYCSDNGDPQEPANWGWEQHEERPYYDSRHNIPFAWWFFFQPSDVKMVEGVSILSGYGEHHWQKARLLADKQEALATFARRRALLLQVAGTQYPAEAMIDYFLQTLAAWPGKFLLCDPSEVFNGYGDSEEVNFAHMTRITGMLDAPGVSAEDIINGLYYSYTDHKDEMNFRVNLLGFTYQFTPGYWMPAFIETEGTTNTNGD